MYSSYFYNKPVKNISFSCIYLCQTLSVLCCCTNYAYLCYFSTFLLAFSTCDDENDNIDNDDDTPVLSCLFQEEFSDYEANDPWVQNLIFNLDGLLTSFKVFTFTFAINMIHLKFSEARFFL